MYKALPCLLALLLLTSAEASRQTQERGVAVQPDSPSGRRLALVIGNDAYPRQPLQNAVADARAMTAALQKYGFSVSLAIDTTYKDLNKEIDRFTAQLRAGDVALVYYAGHGMQIEGENYLVPVDFSAQEEADVKYESYPASRVADRLSTSGVRLSMLVLDACRSNPFRSTRAATRGLAQMDTGKGSLIAFATSPNRTADDNPRGGNGLFTSFLLEAMAEPGLTVEQVFSHARQKVYDASGGRQLPWLATSVIGDFYFRPGVAAAGAPGAAETLFWNSISESESPADFQRYLDKYPDGAFARLARLYVQALTKLASSPTARVSSGQSALIYFNHVRGDKTKVFESFTSDFKAAVRGGSQRVVREQTAGWKVYKVLEPEHDGNMIYLFVIDPAVPGADYGVRRILGQAVPERANGLYAHFYEAVASQNITTLRLVASPGASVDRPPSTTPILTPPASKRVFNSDAGMLVTPVKPESTAQFEGVMRRFDAALHVTSNPIYRQQAASWKIFRVAEPGPNGAVLFISFIEAPVRNADYSITRILADVFPAEGMDLYRQYAESISGTTENLLNLQLVTHLGMDR